MQKRPCDLGYSTRDPSKFVKKNTHDRARLLSLSPTKPPLPTPLASPASSGAAQHAPELPTVRPSLPSGHILRSRPLPSARNQTLVARVSGKASSAHLRQPQMQMKHAMGVPHPPRSPPSSASSRRCEGPHGPAAPQGDGSRHRGCLALTELAQRGLLLPLTKCTRQSYVVGRLKSLARRCGRLLCSGTNG
ncbi:hypothetical protein VPH35_094599 [Triticum aestivum]|uniref:phosphatase and actin regulator 4A isoform X3 n=1 Tax=Triticum aestivum TaxID=4565 RepID=UPI001D00D25C|nr:phosphatase and actin regulator 4A-like isoform X3 [Triticum aestivum]